MADSGKSRRATGKRSPAARAGGKKRSGSGRAGSGSGRSARSSRSASGASARSAGKRRAPAPPSRAPSSGGALDALPGPSPEEMREALLRGVGTPLNLLMLTRDRIEEVVSEAVTRGRMTADDAQSLVQGLVARGREQTTDVLADLEQLLGLGRSDTPDAVSPSVDRATDTAQRARRQVERSTAKARSRATKSADPVLAQADRVRRAAGAGSNFPISGYEDLSAAQVVNRLGDLTPANLRRVRTFEEKNANRKTILGAIDSKLS